jgi:hypothetical protein
VTDRITKAVIVLIPIAIGLYLVYANFVAPHAFTYFYDIGSPADQQKPYLTPPDRLSPVIDNATRNITSGLVYFTVPVARGSDRVLVVMKVGDNFPPGSAMYIGAQDNGSWSYYQQKVYDSTVSSLSSYPHWDDGNYTIYSTLGSDEIALDDLPDEPIASTVKIPSDEPVDAGIGPTVIDNSLRGGHTFYVYLVDGLNLTVSKQDLNWYDGPDDLVVSLYDMRGLLLGNLTLPDDGISAVSKANTSRIAWNLVVRNIPPGAYRLVFSDFDGIIRKITINTDRIVAERLFLADNAIYGIERPSTIYFSAAPLSELRFSTYHASAFQTVLVDDEEIFIDNVTETLSYPVFGGLHSVNSSGNDIIVSTDAGFLAFAPTQLFSPFRKTAALPTDSSQWPDYSYIVTRKEGISVEQDGSDIVVMASFALDGLYVKDGKLSMLVSVPHLGRNDTRDYYIPVDWINITVEKEGLV